jgi:DNA-binding response OmpR family regulator
LQIDGHAKSLQNGSSAQRLPGSRTTAPSRPCRVLVVDDDEMVRARLAALLRISHFNVESAASAEEALVIMTVRRCEILLTDWEMAGMDGLALCRLVRNRRNERYVYVVMHTVRDGEVDLLAGLAAGADDYVFKGAPIEHLLARMEIGRRIARSVLPPSSRPRES